MISPEPNPRVEPTDPAPQPLALVEPASPAAPEAQPQAPPRWSLAKRLLFRFAFAYLVLYNLPFPLDYIPYADQLAQAYSKMWSFIVPQVGQDVFGVDITVEPNGSGDTTFNYVQVFCYLVLALAATAIWTFLDRRRSNYARLHQWLQTYVRYALCLTMLGYGVAKAIPNQFPSPSLDRLLQPFGDASPMGLLWTFMGASAAYTIFAGLSEMLGGLLLLTRRTQLLGALVSMGVMTNVVLLNFCYDVPVKLFSSHLLLMSIFLILPDAKRLLNLLVFNRRVEPAPLQPLFRRKWLHWSALVLRTVFVLGWTGFFLYQGWQQAHEYGNLAPKPPLYGAWNVEELAVDGVARPPLTTDATRWRRVVFGYPGFMAIQLMDDSRTGYRVKVDEKQKTLTLRKRTDPQWQTRLAYREVEPGVLALEGTMDGQKFQARVRRVDESKFQLTSRGFHWINEYPYNR